MRLIETIYLGCNSKEIAEPGNSELIRFDISRSYSHSVIIASLSPAFLHAQLLWQEKAIIKPYKVSVIFPFELNHKRKDSDSETAYDRIKWFINSMKIPDPGMIISIYQNLEAKEWIMDPWFLNSIWPFKDQWEPKGKYITAHYPEAKLGGAKKNKVFNDAPVYLERVKFLAEKYGYDIKWFSYAQPWQEIYDGLKHSDHHFTYIGSTYYFAACMGTPTTGFSYSDTYRSINGSYYDYDTGKRINVTIPEVRWGAVGLNRTRILQYDLKKGVVLNKPVEYVKEATQLEHIDEVFKTQIIK